MGILLASLVVLGDLDATALADEPDRIDEFQPQQLHREREHVTPLAADEALEDPPLRVDGEVRAVAAVQRARAAVRPAAAAQRDVLADDLHDVGLLADLLNQFVRNHRPPSSSYSYSFSYS